MHVIVVGCGRVGSGLAARLSAEGHSVAVIDRRPEAFAKLPKDFDGTTVVGVGFDRERLGAAGVDRADALAAVTSGDNSNILIARVAREALGVERVVARISDPRRAEIYARLGIPTVATVQWTIDRVMRRMLPSGATTEWVDPTAAVSLLERPVPGRWAAKPLSNLESECGGRVVSLTRLGAASLASPGQTLQDGDVIHVAVPTDQIESFDAALTAVATTGGHH
jgi:trk system potassium uptake protein